MQYVQVVLNFIKTWWIALLCGLVGLAGTAGAVVFLLQDDVIQKMQARADYGAKISSLTSNPQNDATIDAEKERAKRFEAQYNETLNLAASINERKPLLEGVFPNPPPNQISLAFRFQELYKDQIYKLPRIMDAGGPPSPQETLEEQERINEELRIKEEQKRDEVRELPTANPVMPVPPTTGFPPGVGPPGGGYPPGVGYPPGGGYPPGMGNQRPGGTTTIQVAGANTTVNVTPEAAYRAAIRKAHTVRVYADISPERNPFYISSIWSTETAPTARDMWYAQVGLWVQQDIANAIRKFNDAKAAQLPEDQQNVGGLPIKRLAGVRVYGYVKSDGQMVPLETGGSGMAAHAASFDPRELPTSFTGRKSTNEFDVVRFSLTVVVDQRELLGFVDQMCRENFYQLISVHYDAGPPTGQEEQYYYGPAPVVVATLHFEGFLARKVYGPMMPAAVRQELGIAEPGQG